MGMTYEYNYEQMADLVNSMIAANSVYNMLMFLLGIAGYVLSAIGLYTIAKRRGIAHAWLAWIPVAWVWVLGSISDQFRYVTKAQVRNKRTTLLVLNLVYLAAMAVVIVMMVVNVVDLVTMGMATVVNEEELMSGVLTMLFQFLGFCGILMVLAIVMAVFTYIALYDLFVSVNPSCAVLFLVLSIFLGVTYPFFIFFNRNKDDGMPPRCDVPQAPVPYTAPDYIPAPVAPEEPWENTSEEE